MKNTPHIVTIAFMQILLFAWTAIFMSSCVTTRSCPIETLQPAVVTIDNPAGSIAICASRAVLNDAIKSNITGEIEIPTDSLIANILFSIKQSWEEAPGYDDTQFTVSMLDNDASADVSTHDLTVQLDDIQITNTFYGEEYSYLLWEAYFHVLYAARFKVFNREGALLDEYVARDLVVWQSGMYESKAEAVGNLPYINDAWWDMGIAVANQYTDRMAPRWETATRHIYMINKFPELSQLAFVAMTNDGYPRAFAVWDEMLLQCRQNRQKRVRSQIMYNMAVACEFQNNIDDAIQWAERAANTNPKTQTASYLNLLRKRKQQQTQLDFQISR